MIIAVMRGVAPPTCLRDALDPNRDFNVPMAPELGLFLVGGPLGWSAGRSAGWLVLRVGAEEGVGTAYPRATEAALLVQGPPRR
jgi:hypothetical protein